MHHDTDIKHIKQSVTIPKISAIFAKKKPKNEPVL